jgi:glycosyltransferase involved in cell wall biosynthesis
MQGAQARQAMPRVYHLITDLAPGGAELFLARLAPRLASEGIPCAVGALGIGGVAADMLREADLSVTCCGMPRGRLTLNGLRILRRDLRAFRPDIVQTWLYHADLVGLAARFLSAPRIVWNLRCSDLRLEHYRPRTRLVVRACAWLSRLPDMILANSQAGLEHHLRLGYRPRASAVIPNGIDLEAFKPDPKARREVRAALGLADKDILIGLPARRDPMKGHALFAQATGQALRQAPGLRFLLYGQGIDGENAELATALAQADADQASLLLGRRQDTPRLHAALDIACSSSLYGEGFSNALAEAMACGVPCVGSAVGDTAAIVGDTGMIVPPGDAEALAQGMLELARLTREQRAQLGAKARQRIREHFSLELAVTRYAEVYRRLCGAFRD